MKSIPQNIEAEQYVLGAILISPKMLPSVLDEVTPEDFYRPSYGEMLRTMSEMEQRREPIDCITLVSRLETKGLLQDVGGRAKVHELATIVPASANAPHYARIVHEAAQRRNLLEIGSKIVRKASEGKGDVAELVDEIEQDIFTLSDPYWHSGFENLDLAPHWNEIVERSEKQGIIGLETGFRAIDQKLMGIDPVNLVIIAARPSVGKSALGFCIALNVAEKKIPVCVASLEMSKPEIINRFLSIKSEVPLYKFRNPSTLRDEEWPLVTKANADLEELPIYVDDTGGMKPFELRSKLRKLKIKEPRLGLVIVDYLQLMGSDRHSESRHQELSKTAKALKNLSKEIKVPIICISQLSRAVEQRADKRPMLSDLRESGALEEDADIVMFIYREDRYDESSDRDPEIIVAKQRNGPTGTGYLKFEARYARFVDTHTAGVD